MALVNKCDRCGRLYVHYPLGDAPGIYNSIARLRKNDIGQVVCSRENIDLCPECMKAFNEFWNGSNKFENTEVLGWEAAINDFWNGSNKND